MTELSPMEQNVYSYIESMIENEGYAPSVRDICRALGIRSTSTAHACLSRLDQKGYIKKDQGKSRALRLGRAKYSDGERMLRVPLLGRVTGWAVLLAAGGGTKDPEPALRTMRMLLRECGAEYAGFAAAMQTDRLPAREDAAALDGARRLARELAARLEGEQFPGGI